MNLRSWLLPACTGLAGLVAGFVLAGRLDHRGDVPDALEVRPGTVIGSDSSDARPNRASATVTLDDIRRVVREEMAAYSPGGQQHVPQPGGPAAQALTREQAAAAAQANAVLDAAISRRQWTDDDAKSLRAQFHELSADQQAELLQRFSVAVNQGRLVPETDQIPF